ncbi:MAG: dTDP-4-dehydrorhamnose reductase [Parcubacteria group bacterium Gr01-1014_33]|nr:MAG: dTDP-4-dehydrorhamnose reductase [Parcubacteria group bacterium Gr01-1014_33]
MNKKIVVIGKTGQVGRALMDNASLFGFDAVGLSRQDLDITDTKRAREIIGELRPDILINTAAYHVLPECEAHPEMALEVNAAAVGKMAALCRDVGAKFVTFSTDYVFDGRSSLPYQEDAPPKPLQWYGLSKRAGEEAANALYPEGSFIIRTCGVYGGAEGSRSRKGNFVLRMLEEARKVGKLEVARNQIASPTYAEDLSQAVLALLSLNGIKAGIYHLVNEGYCSWYEFTKEIFSVYGINKEVVPVDRGNYDGIMQRPQFTALENTKAKALGVSLPSWQDALRRYRYKYNENG